MDAEEKPAEADSMKEQVVWTPLQCSSDPLQFLYNLNFKVLLLFSSCA